MLKNMSDSVQVHRFAKKNKSANKTSHQGYQLPKNVASTETSNSSSIAGLMETIRDQIHYRNGKFHDEELRNLQLVQRSAKEFIDQIFLARNCNIKDTVSSESKQLHDPLDILISNRSLFLQRLEFALRDREAIKLDDASNKTSTSSQPDKIVVLKPTQKIAESPTHVVCSCSSLQIQQPRKSKVSDLKSTHFSFKEITRRLKQVLGENQEKKHWISSISSFYKFSTKKQITIELKPDISSTIRRKSNVSRKSYSMDHDTEAKKHLSERLRNLNTSKILEKTEPPKTLMKILCSPEDDLFSLSSSNIDQESDGDQNIKIPEEISTFETGSERLRREYNLNCSILASLQRDPIARSSSSSSPEELEDVKHGEEREHQSPVSVLEQFFTDNTVKQSLQPRRIDFEFVVDSKEESISEYVRLVIQKRRDKLHEESDLLFDCVNEVFKEVQRQHFGCTPWTSYFKASTRSTHMSENHMIEEVVKNVKCLMNPDLEEPTLNDLVGLDFKKSGSWLDIRFDSEELVNEITDSILQELVVDTIRVLYT